MNQRTWKEFQSVGLLWWVNRILHLFGWAIVLVVNDDGEIEAAYPATVRFRGFDEADEAESFEALSNYLAQQMPDAAIDARRA